MVKYLLVVIILNKESLKKVIIVCSIITVFSLAYILLKKLNNDSLEYDEYLKDYEVNEYIATYISDEAMAKIYLNDYINTMYYDTQAAYELLDLEYRNKKFGNFDEYKSYVLSQTNSSYKVDRYYIKNKDEYKYFGIYDTNGNFYLFKTNGVMQYSVFLDDYTVEI